MKWIRDIRARTQLALTTTWLLNICLKMEMPVLRQRKGIERTHSLLEKHEDDKVSGDLSTWVEITQFLENSGNLDPSGNVYGLWDPHSDHVIKYLSDMNDRSGRRNGKQWHSASPLSAFSTVCIVELGTSTDTVERHQEEILKKSVDA